MYYYKIVDPALTHYFKAENDTEAIYYFHHEYKRSWKSSLPKVARLAVLMFDDAIIDTDTSGRDFSPYRYKNMKGYYLSETNNAEEYEKLKQNGFRNT